MWFLQSLVIRQSGPVSTNRSLSVLAFVWEERMLSIRLHKPIRARLIVEFIRGVTPISQISCPLSNALRSAVFRLTQAAARLFHNPDISLQSSRWILVPPGDASFRHNDGIERPKHDALVLQSL